MNMTMNKPPSLPGHVDLTWVSVASSSSAVNCHFQMSCRNLARDIDM